MLDMKSMIGIMVGNEIEPKVTVWTGAVDTTGLIVNYGEDSLLMNVPFSQGTYTLYLIPYSSITCICKYITEVKP